MLIILKRKLGKPIFQRAQVVPVLNCGAPVAVLAHRCAFPAHSNTDSSNAHMYRFCFVGNVSILLIDWSSAVGRWKVSRREKLCAAWQRDVFLDVGGAGSVETTEPVAFGRFRADVLPAFRQVVGVVTRRSTWVGWGGITPERSSTRFSQCRIPPVVSFFSQSSLTSFIVIPEVHALIVQIYAHVTRVD